MPTRRPVETVYRGTPIAGEWWVEDGLVHVTCTLGSISGPAVEPGQHLILPSEIAQDLLWKLAQQRDPKRPFFYWR